MTHARLAVFVAILGLATAACRNVEAAPARSPMHYASGGNFDTAGAYAPGKLGFDLADVDSADQLALLPPGVKALFWIGQCAGVDEKFIATIRPVLASPKIFGFYLMDDPDPRGVWASACPPANLRAESDWIHARRRDASTFIALMNLASSRTPSFENSYDPRNSHVDLFGVAPYPCRTSLAPCDDDMIDRFVDAALRAGIPKDDIVPIYQTFGCGAWRSDGFGAYRMPSADELSGMLRRWSRLAPSPVFDYAYAWGVQRGDRSLVGAPALQRVMSGHNRLPDSSALSADSGARSEDAAARACS